jgi:hypothetical protein
MADHDDARQCQGGTVSVKLPQGRSKMTPAQIAEAQKLARKWKPKLER